MSVAYRAVCALAVAAAVLATPCVASAQEPHAPPRTEPSSEPDPTLAAGQVAVEVLSSSGEPLRGAEVELTETIQSIAEGNQTHQKRERTSERGLAQFSGLDTSIRSMVSVVVRHGGARYALEAFRLTPKSGQRLQLTVFPTSTDPRQAMVGMRGFIFVELRESEFHFDVLYRVFSLGQFTWIPQGVSIGLPDRMDAFDAIPPEEGFSRVGSRAKLGGSYPPGQKDVRFNFRVPSSNRKSESFTFELPPHVAELRVLAEFAPGLTLEVPGFEPVKLTDGPNGKRVLITRKLLQPGDDALTSVVVGLQGLPVVGPERWFAVVIAGLLALLGLWGALGRRGSRTPEETDERAQARTLILADLVLLERAQSGGEVGPQTYQRVRRELVVALARLEDLTV